MVPWTANWEKFKNVCVKSKNINGAKYVHACEFNDNNESLNEAIDKVIDNTITYSHKVKNVCVKLKNIKYSKYLSHSEFDHNNESQDDDIEKVVDNMLTTNSERVKNVCVNW